MPALPCVPRQPVARDLAVLRVPVSGRDAAPPAPTPYLSLDVGTAVARTHALRTALPGTAIRYAVKANPDPRLLAALAAAGVGFDVASPTEVALAVRAGAPAAELVYSNPVKRRADVADAHARGVRLFVVDSPAEVRKVAEAAPGASVLCRLVTSGAGSDWPLSRKYGCSTQEAVEILRTAAALGLDAAGTAFHVGSQQRDPAAWSAPVEASARVFRALRADGLRPRLVDLGGGFPADHHGDHPDLPAYGAAIRAALRAAFGDDVPRTLVEPGRGLVGDAGTLVSSVIAVLHRGGTRWVYLDAGVFTGPGRDAGGGDPLPHQHLGRRRAHRPGGAGRTHVRQRRRAVPGRPGRAAAGAGRGRPGPPALGRRVHLELLHGGVQRVRPAADRARAMSQVARASWRAPERVVLAHALAAIGMSLPWPLLLLEVSERSSSAWVLGLAAAARMLPYVAISWCAGRLGDHVRRDRLVRATLVGRVVLLGSVGAALLADQVGLAVVAAVLAVAVATPAYPSLAAAMPRLAGRRSERMTALLVTVEVASFVVGPAVGGLLLVRALRPATVPVAVVLVVLAWVLMAGVRLPAATRNRDDLRREPLRRNAPALRAIAAICVVNFVLAATGVALVGIAADVWASADLGYGLATAALGFGALAGPVVGLVVALAVRRRRRAVVGMVLLGAPVAGVALASGHAWALAPLALAGAAATFVEAEATGTLQRSVRDDARAGVLGVTDSAMVAAAMVGALVAPLLAGLAGHRGLVVLLGVLAAAGAGLARGPREDAAPAVVDLREAHAALACRTS